MEILDKYFLLFDEARTSKNAKEELISLFSEDMSFVLAGNIKNGIDEWKKFLDLIYENNADIKHMHEEWKFNKSTNRYEAKWAVCGKSKDGKIYTKLGIDIAEIDEQGKIKYLENVPDDSKLFENYK